MIISKKKVSCTSPKEIANIVKAIVDSFDDFEQEKEHFFVIGLNNKNVIQYIDLVSIGTVSETIVHPREIFRYGILKNISSLIVAHNHPSGNVEPSRDDLKTTEQLSEAGDILGIKVLDHIIVSNTNDNYFSLREASH